MWGLPANADDYYQIAIKEIISSGTGVSPVQAQANVHGRRIGHPQALKKLVGAGLKPAPTPGLSR
jgi:hypothetical protein